MIRQPPDPGQQRRVGTRLALVVIGLVAAGLGALAWQRLRPVTVAVGVDRPQVYGGAMDPSDLNSVQLFLEEQGTSPIRLKTMFNSADPRQGPDDVRALLDQGVRFFINTQTSSHAVPSLELFSDDRALTINVSATSTALSNRDDYFLRIIPDLVQEQRAIAAQINQLGGERILVLRDSHNASYSAPALEEFLRALEVERPWQVTVRDFSSDAFDPKRKQALVEQPFDLLYILGGDFLPTMGNLAQLFHQANPAAPIMLTPWARSPALLENAGDAHRQILIASPYPDRRKNRAMEHYLNRHKQRFGYEPYGMSIGSRQAIELLDQAFRRGHRTPAAVRRYLLNHQPHRTSLGVIRFTPSGDVEGQYHFLRPAP
jgi:branched-chain amino acid transport system substrate-binding protein